MERLRSKSVLLTSYLEFLLTSGRKFCELFDRSRREKRTGAARSFPFEFHRMGGSLCERLAREGIVGDWREPERSELRRCRFTTPIRMFSGFADGSPLRLARITLVFWRIPAACWLLQ